jgi:hypothetical protein
MKLGVEGSVMSDEDPEGDVALSLSSTEVGVDFSVVWAVLLSLGLIETVPVSIGFCPGGSSTAFGLAYYYVSLNNHSLLIYHKVRNS